MQTLKSPFPSQIGQDRADAPQTTRKIANSQGSLAHEQSIG